MASKLLRYTQRLFGVNAGGSRIAVFGSLAAGSPTAYSGATITPALVQQELGQFEEGLDGSVIANSSPPIQDHNALFYLSNYQLAYLMQQGIPEYDGSTQYFSNSIVMASTGVLYQATGSTVGVSPPSSPWEAVLQSNLSEPQTTVLSSVGSGTYTAPTGYLYLEVLVQGGGAGGASGANNHNGSFTAGVAGASGNDSSFGTGSYQIIGGGGNQGSGGNNGGGTGGAGGGTTVGSAVQEVINFLGNAGQTGGVQITSLTIGDSFTTTGGGGGGGFFGGGTVGGANGGTAGASAFGYGAGGGGGGANVSNASTNTNGVFGGGGGGGGGCVKAIYPNTLGSTFNYVVGNGGTGGSSPASGLAAGGNGAHGKIVITAYFQ